MQDFSDNPFVGNILAALPVAIYLQTKSLPPKYGNYILNSLALILGDLGIIYGYDTGMAKCGVKNCKGVVVNGLKQVAHAGHSLAPKATIDSGYRFYWCEDHEHEVRVLAASKFTKPLTKKQLSTELR